jgi:hypothetical protein
MSHWLIRSSFMAGVLFSSLAAVSQAAAPQPAPAAQQNAAAPPTATAQPAPVTAKKPEDELKVVTTAGNHLRVQIVEPSNLSKVFKAICTEQKLECTGADTLAGYSVPTMSVDGTLREVVDNLLNGTDVNYRYTQPTAATKAKLVLLGHAPQGNNAPLPARGPKPDGIPLHSMRYPGNPPANTGASEPAQPQQ